VAPGEIVDVDVPMFNNGRRQNRFAFRADSYAGDTATQVSLELRFNTGRERWPLSRQLGSLVPRLRFADPPEPKRPTPGVAAASVPGAASTPHAERRFTFGRPKRRLVTRARYAGHEAYRQALLAQDVRLPAGMAFETPGIGDALELPAHANQTVPVRIRIPAEAQDGTEYSINVRAEDAQGRLRGGVTFLLRVKNP
jgi:hypothetical protein